MRAFCFFSARKPVVLCRLQKQKSWMHASARTIQKNRDIQLRKLWVVPTQLEERNCSKSRPLYSCQNHTSACTPECEGLRRTSRTSSPGTKHARHSTGARRQAPVTAGLSNPGLGLALAAVARSPVGLAPGPLAAGGGAGARPRVAHAEFLCLS